MSSEHRGGQKYHRTAHRIKAVLFTFMVERERNNGLVGLQKSQHCRGHVRCLTADRTFYRVNFPTSEEKVMQALLFIDISVPSAQFVILRNKGQK